jgi:endonuclease/exonuclease/phosphatase family metal-dependent hydrolase
LRRIVYAVAAFTVLAAGSGSAGARGEAAEPIVLRVMTFNIWYGATPTHGLDEVVEAIRAAGADVVGMQEPYARLRRIAAELGFHASPRMHVISRYPILEPGGSDGAWAYLLLDDGLVAAIMNTHLPATPYTPYRIVNRGFDRATILQQEARTRLRRIESELEGLAPVLDAQIPTFFTGDFNAPSHHDWTRAAVAARGLPYPVRWPVSLAMEAAGFRDSFREVHPDPLADPGFTWTPGYPAPFVYPWDVHDRIDFVWAAGPAVTLDSRVVGEATATSDVIVSPWPADHRSVVSTFEVTPAAAPPFVASGGERHRLGNPLDVWFHSGADAAGSIALAAAATGEVVAELPAAGSHGSLAFATSTLAQGTYDLVLRDAAGAERARDRVVLVSADQAPVLTVADDTLRGDQALEVAWAFAPGNRYDWLAVYPAGVSAKDGPFERWRYTGGEIEGRTTVGAGARGPAAWPLDPGEYEVRLCLDDSYRCRSSAAFTVSA